MAMDDGKNAVEESEIPRLWLDSVGDWVRFYLIFWVKFLLVKVVLMGNPSDDTESGIKEE